ncbi:MAG: hypothetical protein KDI71_11020 [Xanthomonadales bacterium]|nr:hypothetical protein [Xanthomonadales bacterium]
MSVSAQRNILGDCIPNPRTINAFELLPYDPGVTGIQNTPYTPPLKIESRPLSVWFELFKDGFESGAIVQKFELLERMA